MSAVTKTFSGSRTPGIQVDPAEGENIMAVAGGTGLGALYQVARDVGNAEVFAGVRTYNRVCVAGPFLQAE